MIAAFRIQVSPRTAAPFRNGNNPEGQIRNQRIFIVYIMASDVLLERA